MTIKELDLNTLQFIKKIFDKFKDVDNSTKCLGYSWLLHCIKKNKNTEFKNKLNKETLEYIYTICGFYSDLSCNTLGYKYLECFIETLSYIDYSDYDNDTILRLKLVLTKKEKLKFYNRAILDYFISIILPFKSLKRYLNTDIGFCRYIYKKDELTFKYSLPELYNIGESFKDKWYDSKMWYNMGDCKPRLKLLLQARKQLLK